MRKKSLYELSVHVCPILLLRGLAAGCLVVDQGAWGGCNDVAACSALTVSTRCASIVPFLAYHNRYDSVLLSMYSST